MSRSSDNEKLLDLMNLIQDPVFVVNSKNLKIENFNETAKSIWELKGSELQGASLYNLVHEKYKSFLEVFIENVKDEGVSSLSDIPSSVHFEYFFDIYGKRHQNEDEDVILVYFKDISSEKLSEEKIESLKSQLKNMEEKLSKFLTKNPETNLFVKNAFLEMMKREHARSVRKNISYSILFMEIINYQDVFEALDESTKKQLSIELGRSFKEQIRNMDEAAQFDSSHYAIYCPDCNEEGAFLAAKRIQESLLKIWEKNYQKKLGVDLHLNFGSSTYPESASFLEDALKRAQLALKQSKEAGANEIKLYKKNLKIAA